MAPAEESVLHAHMRAALDSRRQRSIIRRPHPDAFIPAPQNLVVQPRAQTAYRLFLKRLSFAVHLCASPRPSPRISPVGTSDPGLWGSRLLDGTHEAHLKIEQRLAKFFCPEPRYPSPNPTALLFNSGFDANVALFSVLPQPGDWIIYDELVHASVHDGMRSSRLAQSRRIAFKHSCVRIWKPRFDGRVLGPTRKTVRGCGRGAFDWSLWDGRGWVEQLGLGSRVHVRLHTFGKAMASSGGIVICDSLTREYLINYARTFIFTTAPTIANVIAMGCSFDMVDNGTTQRLAAQLFKISTRFTTALRTRLENIPPRIMALPPFLKSEPTPIVPILTPHPRQLAQHLRERGFLARPINIRLFQGRERVRVCLHAANTEEEVDGLVDALLEWAEEKRSGPRLGGRSFPIAKL
ncbi:Aminotransferase class I and II [Rhizoctonia solani]|uniref:Aminotransferase class I and II n=1 Tax=Rhizoctonia solani TaxID=456999 RepID=A0A8H7LZ34_9AGAM|nr:Aminotransferase class I and II [Rhizoctonia solani]